MGDRSKLTNLIAEAEDEYMVYEMAKEALPFGVFKSREEYIADYIITNGVIPLPCKVGDTVYTFSFNKIIEAEVIRVEWSCEAENYGKFVRGKITLYAKGFEEIRIDFYDLDKLFYLTPEEAEKALERSKGNA